MPFRDILGEYADRLLNALDLNLVVLGSILGLDTCHSERGFLIFYLFFSR
jgi:hypothetical protein